jgi:predicted Zn-dependent peptidase
MPGLNLDWQMVRLANGMRLITIERPGSPTVAVRVYVRAGSRYDVEQGISPPPLGLAHSAEHLISKGTRSRGQREIFAAVEHLGGVLEAGTSKEYCSFYTVVPHEGLETAVDILADLLIDPALREEDFWAEKLVILEEICRAEDRESTIFELFGQTLWQRSPLRNPIRGTLQALHGLDYTTLRSYHERRYTAGNILLVVCGDIGHGAVQQLVAERFAGLRAGPERLPESCDEPPLGGQRKAHLERDVQRALLLIGVPTVSMKHEDRSALKLMERVLGMGGSARLYQRLRQETQLAYSVHTVTAHYEDAGYFAVHTACHPKDMAQVQHLIWDEWVRLREQGVAAGEVDAAKANYAGTLALRFETNLALAGIMGVEGLLHRVEPFDEAVQRINEVRPDDVQRVARQYLDPERCVVVTVGPGVEPEAPTVS